MIDPSPAEKARNLLDSHAGTATERAQVWATLALVEAVDRLTAAAAPDDHVEITSLGDAEPRYLPTR